MLFEKIYNYPFNLELIKNDCLGKSGVYLILNTINNESYIGSATSISDKHNRLYFKFRNHFFNSHKINNILLHKSIIKYGKHNFSFNIIVFDRPDRISDLVNFYINFFKPTFNILVGMGNFKENYCYDLSKFNFKTNNLISVSKKIKLNNTVPKLTSVYDLNNNFIKLFNSAKDLSREYKIDYRTIKQHLKTGKPIYKLRIIIKYNI
jgi:hypothetical protein